MLTKKTQQVGFRLLPATKLAIERAARDDSRSVSSLVEKVLTEWLIETGHLKNKEPKK